MMQEWAWDREGLAAGEAGEVCSTSSQLSVKPSHKGGSTRGWWGRQSRATGKLAPKPLPFQLQEALPVLVVEGVSDGGPSQKERD